MVFQRVTEDGCLTGQAIHDAVTEAVSGIDVTGKRVLVLIPDQTRSMPMPTVFRALVDSVARRADRMDVLVALGTHPPLTPEALARHLGFDSPDALRAYAPRNVAFHNHAWDDPDALVEVGVMEADEIARISGGLLRESAPVEVNRRATECDLILIAGPVFPHEVVGFSGGNKYLFPGISGPRILHLFHWLGALLTNMAVNGTKHTPVREVVDRAAAMVPVEKRCLAFNVTGDRCAGVYFGSPEEAWEVAADHAARTHIVYTGRTYQRVLAIAPAMYDDLWVAGKCMYKLEPIVADGGELVIYAPHLREISFTHGALIRRVGYHTRDYFLARMDAFRDIPRGILAHATHVRGVGSHADGVERCRVQVTLATAIPEAVCKEINLGYRDPAGIDPDAWRGAEDAGCLVVDHAGEVLYRPESGPPA